MDKRQWYFEQLVTEGEMNEIFDLVEAAIDRIPADTDFNFHGILDGLTVVEDAPPSLDVLVNAGKAYSENGERILIASQQTLDCSVDYLSASTTVTTPGEFRLLSVFLIFDRLESDGRIDGHGTPLFYDQDEYFRLEVHQGAQAVSPAFPAIPNGYVLLADILRSFGDVTIDNADIDGGGVGTRRTYGGVKEVESLVTFRRGVEAGDTLTKNGADCQIEQTSGSAEKWYRPAAVTGDLTDLYRIGASGSPAFSIFDLSRIPRTATITRIRAGVSNGAADSVEVRLYQRDNDSAPGAIVATAGPYTDSGTGNQIVDSGTISIVLDASQEIRYLECESNTDTDRIYWIKVEYTVPGIWV
jgi:hypothetical protein